jgi:hypothetical protein
MRLLRYRYPMRIQSPARKFPLRGRAAGGARRFNAVSAPHPCNAACFGKRRGPLEGVHVVQVDERVAPAGDPIKPHALARKLA